jgi:hypothetical protein
MATEQQQNYLAILFGDLSFNRASRNLYLTERIGREIHYLDELNTAEASRIIDMLREQKDRLAAQVRIDEEDD